MGLTLKSVLKAIVLLTVIFTFVFPIYYMIILSISSPTHIPTGAIYPDFFFGKWYEATSGEWARCITNSLIICSLSVIFNILVTYPAGYVFSRYTFMADRHLFFWFLTNRMAPPAALIVPYLIIWRSLGIWDTYQGTILAYSVFNIPLSVWLFTSFMKNIPKELDEQAFIDGFSLLTYWRKIFIPASLPSIGIVSFFIWLFSWSEMFMSTILTSFNSKPINNLLFITLGRMGSGVEYGLAAAVGVITILPGLILLYWARTFLAKGFTFGRV